jgi:hypothetical protein
MMFWKRSLITAMAFFGIAATTLVVSCEQDSCVDLKCVNGGSCADGFCRCPTGYEGAECEIKSSDRFVGKFFGYKTCTGYPSFPDTVEIFMHEEPVTVKYVLYSRKQDTLTAIVKGTHLEFETLEGGNYRRHVTGDFLNNKLRIYDDEIFDTNTGNRQVCEFTGLK